MTTRVTRTDQGEVAVHHDVGSEGIQLTVPDYTTYLTVEEAIYVGMDLVAAARALRGNGDR